MAGTTSTFLNSDDAEIMEKHLMNLFPQSRYHVENIPNDVVEKVVIFFATASYVGFFPDVADELEEEEQEIYPMVCKIFRKVEGTRFPDDQIDISQYLFDCFQFIEKLKNSHMPSFSKEQEICARLIRFFGKMKRDGQKMMPMNATA